MGYQAEGPQWRGILLTAAKELRAVVQLPPFTTGEPGHRRSPTALKDQRPSS